MNDAYTIFARFEASVHKTLYVEGNLDVRGIYLLFERE